LADWDSKLKMHQNLFDQRKQVHGWRIIAEKAGLNSHGIDLALHVKIGQGLLNRFSW
jgi:hypothetical protein